MTSLVRIGDCRTIMPTLPAAHFDVCIADPPYGETTCAWDRRVDGWIEHVARVLKPNGSLWVFGSFRFLASMFAEIEEHDFKLAQDVIWEKHNGTGLHADRFRRVHEIAAHFYRGPWADVFKEPQFTQDAVRKTIRRKRKPAHWSAINGGHYASEDGGPLHMRSVIYCKNEHGRAIHPTQKPVELLLSILRYSCPRGGAALDPFAGSASLGVAAKLHGCEVTLIEGDSDMAAKAETRLRDEAPLLASIEKAA